MYYIFFIVCCVVVLKFKGLVSIIFLCFVVGIENGKILLMVINLMGFLFLL